MANDYKYFLTSDKKFLISVEDVILIVSLIETSDTSYTDAFTLDTQIFKIQNNIDQERTSKVNVYLKGLDSPIQLQYNDGILLRNIIGEKYGSDKIFYNAYCPGKLFSYTNKANTTYTIPSTYVTPNNIKQNIEVYTTIESTIENNSTTYSGKISYATGIV